ncbi:hypothetical protein U9M48_030648 [Paspalum notatum var. saurae]|uniref:Uncharacterized protein n=1 Tax=Paspalum notatum var. saurae TaxID=547442 RepID=A0AAQ3U131_PASNO
MNINHGIEEQTQEQPLIEEPKDQEPNPQPEDLQQAADFAPDDTDLSEEESLAALALAPTLAKDPDVSKQALRKPYGVPLLRLCWWRGLLSPGVREVVIWRGGDISGLDVALLLQVFCLS